MDTIKGRNGMDLTEAEDTKKRWQEYTELYMKEKVGELASLKLKNFCFAKDNVKKISHRQRENVQIHIWFKIYGELLKLKKKTKKAR